MIDKQKMREMAHRARVANRAGKSSTRVRNTKQKLDLPLKPPLYRVICYRNGNGL
jgi:hypothetical protein